MPRRLTILPGLLLLAAAPPVRDDAALREAMLAAHNDERQARGVPPLVWSEELAGEAAERAASLVNESDPVGVHSRGVVGQPHGENLWLGTRGDYRYAEMAGKWLGERTLYVDGFVPDISSSGKWGDVGHYSQMIWSTTQRIGCALASSKSIDLLICRYDPAGNEIGRNALTNRTRP